ncbi:MULTISPECIES: cell division protein FtsQ/DivIB [Pseudacidovorax]|uniref:cell division protein FtsQ/DivIB n=1 Tax=Pseudacidovorax TaxID=433923 RepID=UPI001B11040C|nr:MULTISPECIES: cell division protein FtsQ/DivIB [Pseudacidovorax]MBO9646515.1 cell division protein FtsQ/DivIB [Pseudacidovorax sp.]
MADGIAVPLDVRLMNLTATVLYALCGLMLLAAGGWWVLRQPFLPLGVIRVDGDVTHNNPITLRANVAPRLAGNFFTVDLQRARVAFESVPWVRKAVVRREFPNALRATLTEHVPAALWGAEDESRMINTFGEVFEANTDEAGDDLPRLEGPDDQASQVLGMYRELAPAFDGSGLKLTELRLSTRGGWQAVLDSGATVEIGRGTPEEVVARVRRFLLSARHVAAQYGRSIESIESADLRHADAYAVRIRGVTTVSADAPAAAAARRR